jgi:hypothetical protein
MAWAKPWNTSAAGGNEGWVCVIDGKPLSEDPRVLGCNSFFEFPPHDLSAVLPAP